MSQSAEEFFPQTQPHFSGRPPRPPKITARGLEDPDDPERVIHVPDPVMVRDLAAGLNVKPFKIVADLLLVRQFKTSDALIDFKTAAMIAGWHGHVAIETFR